MVPEGMGILEPGGVRHEASVSSPACQWSVGALRWSSPRSLLLPGKGVLCSLVQSVEGEHQDQESSCSWAWREARGVAWLGHCRDMLDHGVGHSRVDGGRMAEAGLVAWCVTRS